VIRFESKRDWTFPFVWGFLSIIYSIVGIVIISNGGDYSELIVLAVVWALQGTFYYLFLKTTFYTIDEEYLVCHSFGFKKRIRVSEIRRIKPQNGFYAGLKINTAWKGMVVTYGKWDEILISPAQEQQFIETIKTKNPTLQA